jgi:hypothetical protein
MSSNKALHSRIEDIRSGVKQNPAAGLDYLDDVTDWIVHEDERVRYEAVELVVLLSAEYPQHLRQVVPAITSRLDDRDRAVRAAALTAVHNLASWYPQDFAHVTELLYTLSQSESVKERAAAIKAISSLTTQRPDIVTPREKIQSTLIEFLDTDQVQSVNHIDREYVEAAVDILEGSDMASRPVEADLAPIPRRTELSKPAQVGFRAAVWGLLLPFAYFIGLLNAVRFSYRYRHLSGGSRLRIMMSDLRKLKFFPNRHQRRLYLRASMWPTATQLLPGFPGRAPVSEKPRQESPPLPDDWSVRASLVRERDDFYCRNCGKGGGPNGDAELHVDHQTPRSAGGEDHPSNLRTLCRTCHEARHARVFAK